jgi:hypothetical protein
MNLLLLVQGERTQPTERGLVPLVKEDGWQRSAFASVVYQPFGMLDSGEQNGLAITNIVEVLSLLAGKAVKVIV